MKVIIDCDPGIDDALAIAMALRDPKLEILGITTVCGNRSLERTTSNALRTLEYFGRIDIPVYSGSERPLRRESFMPGSNSPHGMDGLGDSGLPEPRVLSAGKDAVGFMKRELERRPGEITILATGPLTNIAKLFAIVESGVVKEIYAMSGAFWVPGNVTEHAEYNAFFDPEAARAVYSSGTLMKVVGLDVTDPVTMSKEEFESIRRLDSREARFFAATHRWAIEKKNKERYSIFWDPIALAWMLDRSLIRAVRGRVEVEVLGEMAGRTSFTEDPNGRILAGRSIDPERFFARLQAFLKGSLPGAV